MEELQDMDFRELHAVCVEKGIKVEADDDRETLLKKLTSKPDKSKPDD